MTEQLSEERRQQVLDLCRDLIRIRSYSGEEDRVAQRLGEFCKLAGFDEVRTDEYGNLICIINGNRPGPTILSDGHMDTVPVQDPGSWKHDPFGAEIVDGIMYGRGTSDMKCALACMAAAAGFFAKDTGRDFAGRVAVAGIVHEECFEGVASRAVSRDLKPDLVVIGEASELKLKIGQRGRAEILLETYGVPAHSSNPEKGVNAIRVLTNALLKLNGLKDEDHRIIEFIDNVNNDYYGSFLGIDNTDEVSGQTVSSGTVLKFKDGHISLLNDCRYCVTDNRRMGLRCYRRRKDLRVSSRCQRTDHSDHQESLRRLYRQYRKRNHDRQGRHLRRRITERLCDRLRLFRKLGRTS